MSRNYSLFIGLLILLSSCKSVQHLTSTEVTYVKMDSSLIADTAIESLIQPYRTQMADKMDRVIGLLEEDLIKSRPHSNMGNWFADVLHTEADKMFFEEVDFALQNYGGLRSKTLAKGDVTVGKIYELMPFDNQLVVLNIPGPVFHKLMNALAEKNGWPVSRGLSFAIDNSKAVDVLINGEPFDESKTYRVAIPDYIANGGDQADYLTGLDQEQSGVFIRDVIISHLEELQEKGLPIEIDHTERISKK